MPNELSPFDGESLRQAGRPQLAEILEKYGALSLKEYSAHLYDFDSVGAIEEELLNALTQEFQRVNVSENISEVLDSLLRTRVIQTATHLTASEGPTFFAIHQLATLKFPRNEYYLVGAFSGIPFSNSAWSGCLNYSHRHSLEKLVQPKSPLYQELFRAEKNRNLDTKEQRLSFIPGKMREARVYQAQIPKKMEQIVPYLAPFLQRLLPPMQVGASYTQWALQFCKQQMQPLLPQQKLLYFDLNEVIRLYLQQVIQKPDHPIAQFFFDPQCRQKVLSVFGEEVSLFTHPFSHTKGFKQESMRVHENSLKSAHHTLPLTPEALYYALAEGFLCPGIFLTFISLSFINGFKCLGSFEQIEYLADYRNKLQRCDWLNPEVVQAVDVLGLTTGRCLDEEGDPVFPLDVLLGTPWEFPQLSLNQFLSPLWSRLLP